MVKYDKLTKQIQRTTSSLINVSKYWLRKRRPGPISVVSSIPISVLDIWAICHNNHTQMQTMWQCTVFRTIEYWPVYFRLRTLFILILIPFASNHFSFTHFYQDPNLPFRKEGNLFHCLHRTLENTVQPQYIQTCHFHILVGLISVSVKSAQ